MPNLYVNGGFTKILYWEGVFLTAFFIIIYCWTLRKLYSKEEQIFFYKYHFCSAAMTYFWLADLSSLRYNLSLSKVHEFFGCVCQVK